MRSVLVVAALAACYRAPAPAPPANKAPTPDYAAAVRDELAFLPIDSDFVFGLRLSELRQSQLWQVFEPQLESLGRQVQEISACPNFDFTREIDQISFGFKGRGREDINGVIVMRGSAPQRALDCSIAEAKRKGGTVTVDRGVTITTDPSSSLTSALMVIGNSLVMQIDRGANHDTLYARLQAGAPLRGSPVFMKMYDRREPNASLWGMANGNSPLFQQMASSGFRPKGVDGTIVVTSTLNATMRMTMSTPSEADAIAREIGKVKPMAASYVMRFDVVVKADTAEVHVDLTEAQIRALVGMLGNFGP